MKQFSFGQVPGFSLEESSLISILKMESGCSGQRSVHVDNDDSARPFTAPHPPATPERAATSHVNSKVRPQLWITGCRVCKWHARGFSFGGILLVDCSFPSHISSLMPPSATVLGPESARRVLTRKRDKVGGSPTCWQQAVRQPMRRPMIRHGVCRLPGTGGSPSFHRRSAFQGMEYLTCFTYHLLTINTYLQGEFHMLSIRVERTGGLEGLFL